MYFIDFSTEKIKILNPNKKKKIGKERVSKIKVWKWFAIIPRTALEREILVMIIQFQNLQNRSPQSV